MTKRRKTKKQKEKRKKNLILIIIGALFLFLFVLAGVAVYATVVINQLPPLEDFNDRKVSQSTKIYDRTAEVLLYEIFGEEKRTIVDFNSIPQEIKDATLAAENIDFYNQPAFDWRGILRAAITNLKEGEIVQGGSTITQQLVKNAFLTPERTITRKVKELILAMDLESKYSKDEIFEAYLNQIPYGSNAYGIEAASQTFFNKSIQDLSLSEMATLASLPQAPSYYSPWGNNIEGLINRRDYVLDRMVKFNFISEEQSEEAKNEDVEKNFSPQNIGEIKAPHFSLYVKSYLISKYGEQVALNGGLKVITTLDWEIQKIAERVVEQGAKRNEELYGGNNAALVAQDPNTGQILAMVGSRDYYNEEIQGKFNVPVQGLRQPGSTLKPFAYLTAFNNGFHPKSVLMDVLTEFTVGDPDCPAVVTPQSLINSDCFNPENFDNTFRGPVSLESALSQSINIPSVKMLYLAGFDNVLKTLKDFGINTLNERWKYGLSLVLGGGEVKLIELVNAYSTLADDGVYHDQSIILEIKNDKNQTTENYSDSSKRVFEAQPVRQINKILSDLELRSGLLVSSLPLTIFPEKEVALKTGTTNNYKDAWAVGYTPSFVVGVWAGNNNNQQMHSRGSSLLAAIPMWSNFLNEVFETKEFNSNVFNKPETTTPPNKPMLNGSAVFSAEIDEEILPQLHSSLYWINKENVLGNPPRESSNDSQFFNWEEAIRVWAEKNIENFSEYNKPVPENIILNSIESNEESIIKINNLKPQNGDFIEGPLFVTAEIESEEILEKINLYFNGLLISSKKLSKNNHDYFYYVSNDLSSQNVIEIEIIDENNNKRRESIIVFN
ncbi:MAG: transglycosylase domain-containing protein [Candidatus Paceibacterota bacterium]